MGDNPLGKMIDLRIGTVRLDEIEGSAEKKRKKAYHSVT